MTSPTGARIEGGSELSRHVAIVPAVAGLASAASLLVGARLVGLSGGDGTPLLVWLAAALVVAAMLTGFWANQHLGIGVFAVAVLVAGIDGTGSLIVVIVALWTSHELGRFSLDARLPSRFGPGYLRRFASRAAVTAVFAIVAVALAPSVAALRPPTVVVPLGLAMATAPLFARRAVTALPVRRRDPQTIRWALGLLLATIAVAGGLIGAAAQQDVAARISARPEPAAETTPATNETTATPTAEQADRPGPVQAFLSIIAVLVALLVAGLVVAGLRRPEVPFELDELQLDDDDFSLSLSRGGVAELDDHTARIDERAYAELLDALLLDLTGEPDPSRAIRYGYATIERRLRALGVSREASETERELLVRALPAIPGGREALVTLTRLFEVARFSVEPVSEDMRHRALDAVRDLQDSLDPTGATSEIEQPQDPDGGGGAP